MNCEFEQLTQDLSGQKEKNLMRFIDALKECLRTEAFDRISVSSIVETAGMSRQTFYRCCESKYDLVNKYLGMIILKSYRELAKGLSLEEALSVKFRSMEPEKELFARTGTDNNFESLRSYTHRLILSMYMDMYEEDKYGEMDWRLQMLIDMHCEESVYITLRWAGNEIDSTPEDMARLLVEAMPEKVKNVYQKYLV